jgi:dipeptidyl aminopeptidase/acylaminoacyl peptidase
LLVESGRFKAAVAADGWGDSMGAYGILDRDGSAFQNGQMERQVGGLPWQNPLAYVENSPAYFLDRVVTPLLLIHGSADLAMSPFLSDQVFVGMQRLDKDIEYARYEGEPHAPPDWSHANQVDLASRILRWFDRYLNGNEPGVSNSAEAR